MRKLKIGYWPLSESLLAAGDRRRLVFWANARGHEIVRDLNQNVDVIVASENSDFNSPISFENPLQLSSISLMLIFHHKIRSMILREDLPSVFQARLVGL